MDLDWTQIVAIVAAGVVGGAVNTLVGGGTLIVLPLLVFLGIDPLVANGTNRICVAFQAGVAGWTMNRGLRRQEQPPATALTVGWTPILLVGLAAIPGAWGAIEIESIDKGAFRELMGWVLLVAVGAFLLPRPKTTQDSESGTRPGIFFYAGCLLCGFYGGFIGAGVGAFIVLLLTTSLRLTVVDAVRWKVWCVMAMSAASGTWYLASGVIDARVAIPLIPAYGVGAYLGGRIALRGGDRLLRPIVALLSAGLALSIIFGVV